MFREMKKYRIIKLTTIEGEERYAIEERFLWFLWREKLERDIDGCFVVYDSREKAESVLKQYMYKPKKEIIWEY